MSKEKTAEKNGTNGATVTETPAAQVPEVTKKEKLALFKAYEDAEVAVDKLEAQLVEARAKRSEAVRAIAEKCGNGPFGYKGAELRIMSRDGTYFFRGRGERTVDLIA